MTVHEKLLDKLAKIKRMADGAKAIGSEAEAQAFADALQRMLLEHKLEMSDIEFDTMEKDSPVERHHIDYAKYNLKVKKTRVAWMEELAIIVARAHFCKILVQPGSSRITLVGRREDCVVAEYTLITLQRAAETISARAYDAYRNEERRNQIAAFGEAGKHGSMPHTFGFRESFIGAFISRLRERLKNTAENAASASSTALVRVNRSTAAVEAYIASLHTGKASGLSRVSQSHGEGIKRGRAAADAIEFRKGVSTTTRGQLR